MLIAGVGLWNGVLYFYLACLVRDTEAEDSDAVIDLIHAGYGHRVEGLDNGQL